ncbi:hypothetical protein SDRG_12387 [Saprolegnia diclina VS20]|uniref:Uncharacterized protein n=1 Tax=Saprolegnia diclina (strain VS20) TaxID=1156394 RepID=T0Q8N2_SAPDV|nr:hypothetical protein SDRG_12387 [Saprolegnia diclina VS20]EQC29840.1 hypothetical protein SDRG_12387 [Saprolegnia diclina VS20]|eukprot:XP_008616679.1 hypothetical protein SDRG_12387 [Saprolegnia diclina VS20]
MAERTSKPTATRKAVAPRNLPALVIETDDASTPPASTTPPTDAPAAKAKDVQRDKHTSKKANDKKDLWPEATVRKLFELRYDPSQASRFNSKCNMIKNYANECLAAELSGIVERTFTVKQVSNKMTRLKAAWTDYKTSTASDTEPTLPPVHLDIMAKYWSDTPCVQRKPKTNTATAPGSATPPSSTTTKTYKKRKIKRTETESKPEPVYWCDDSVRKLLELRYDPSQASQFNSTNNMTKKGANLRLAAELSRLVGRTFSVKQISNKITRLRTTWAAYQASLLESPESPPDPDTLPIHLDVMMAFWSDTPNAQLESLASTNNVDNSNGDNDQSSSESEEDVIQKKRKTSQCDKRSTKKPRSPPEVVKARVASVRDELVPMGQTVAESPTATLMMPGSATLDDVLGAIKAQSTSTKHVLDAIQAQSESTKHVLDAIKTQSELLAQMIAAMHKK